jgi:hypothetical protein
LKVLKAFLVLFNICEIAESACKCQQLRRAGVLGRVENTRLVTECHYHFFERPFASKEVAGMFWENKLNL